MILRRSQKCEHGRQALMRGRKREKLGFRTPTPSPPEIRRARPRYARRAAAKLISNVKRGSRSRSAEAPWRARAPRLGAGAVAAPSRGGGHPTPHAGGEGGKSAKCTKCKIISTHWHLSCKKVKIIRRLSTISMMKIFLGNNFEKFQTF